MLRLSRPKTVAGQLGEHGEEGKGVNIMFGGFEGYRIIARVHAADKAARAAGAESVIDNPLAQPHGSIQEAMVRTALKELRQRHSGPGHVSGCRPNKEKRRKSFLQEYAVGVRLVDKISL